MTTAQLPIHFDQEKLAQFCVERGIERLSLFGSVLRDDFDPVHSDVDVLVELSPSAHPGFRFFGYAEELSRILGQAVDLNTPAMLNAEFRSEVLRASLILYEQA